jgi:uncharacterized protein YaiI (UPF0178 family)
MRIWVDADACPNVIKDILFRAAERARVTLTLVANQPIRTPPSQYINALQVPAGFDVADNKIVELAEAGDLVVTADIPLAAGVIEKGGHALDPRGETYTRDNIKERLAMRKLMDELRSSGIDTGGPATFSNADRQAFANKLDRFLAGNSHA